MMKKMTIAFVLTLFFISVASPVLAGSDSNFVTMFINVSDDGYFTLGGTYHGQAEKLNAVALMLDGERLLIMPSRNENVSAEIIQHLPDGRHTLTVYGFEKMGDEWVQKESAKADFMVGEYTVSGEFVVRYERIGSSEDHYIHYCVLYVPEDSDENSYTDWVHYPGMISSLCSMAGETQDWRGVEISRGYENLHRFNFTDLWLRRPFGEYLIYAEAALPDRLNLPDYILDSLNEDCCSCLDFQWEGKFPDSPVWYK